MPQFSEGEFRTAMGQFATGVVVVTGICEGQPLGFSAQSFVSVSLAPPLIAFCPAALSRSWPQLRRSGHFGINILGADQEPTCARFAGAGDRFAGLSWVPAASGAPILASVLGFIDCRLEAEHPAGDHSIVIGRVLELKLLDTRRKPLLFFRGRYGAFDHFSPETGP